MSTMLHDPAAARAPISSPFANPLWTERAVLLVQADYYGLTGLWPIFDIVSFQAVTGPKTDVWLVRTVGLLIALVAAVLLLAARHRHPPLEVVVLAIGAALALATVDVLIVFAQVGSPAYLLDALLELGLVAWWVGVRKPPAAHSPFADEGVLDA